MINDNDYNELNTAFISETPQTNISISTKEESCSYTDEIYNNQKKTLSFNSNNELIIRRQNSLLNIVNKHRNDNSFQRAINNFTPVKEDHFEQLMCTYALDHNFKIIATPEDENVIQNAESSNLINSNQSKEFRIPKMIYNYKSVPLGRKNHVNNFEVIVKKNFDEVITSMTFNKIYFLYNIVIDFKPESNLTSPLNIFGEIRKIGLKNFLKNIKKNKYQYIEKFTIKRKVFHQNRQYYIEENDLSSKFLKEFLKDSQQNTLYRR